MTGLSIPASKEWLTAADAAGEKLPSFELTERHIRRFLSSSGIATRRRTASGGGREFHWTNLPREARDEYLKRHGVAEPGAESAPPAARAAQKDIRAEARAQILDACAAFLAERRGNKADGLRAFCAAYEARSTKLPDWLFRIAPSVEPHQLRSWEAVIRKKGHGALIDRRGRPSGTTIFDKEPALRVFVIGALAARPQLCADAILRDMRANYKAGSLAVSALPPLRTLQRYISTHKKTAAPEIKALTFPDKFRSHHQPAFGSRSAQVTRINALWEIDGTRADAMCRMADGSQRRMALIALVDVFTRRGMVLVTDEGRAAATKALLRRAILTWGVPGTLKADNGKDFVAADVLRFCRDTGITIKFSRPFHPEEKPHIERFFGTLNSGFLPLLPGYVGRDVAQRKAIESRNSFSHRFGDEARLVIETSLSPEGLQARIDRWIADVYEQRIHSELGAAPAAWANVYANDVQRIASERALDALLLPPADGGGLRVVGKRGISIARRDYIAPELGAYMGHRVHVRLDPTDLGRVVVYRNEGGEFICVAEDAAAISDDRRANIARAAQGVQRTHLRVIRSDVRKAQAAFPAAGMADRILNDAGGDSFVLSEDARSAMAAAQGPRLVELARAADALDAARRAPQPVEPTDDERAEAEAAFTELRALNAPPAERLVQCDGYERPAFDGDDVGFWLWAHDRITRSEPIDARDRDIIDSLTTDSGFQLQLRIATTHAG